MTLRRRVLVMVALLSLTTLLLGLVTVNSTRERERLFERFGAALLQDEAFSQVDGCVEDLHRQMVLLFQSGAALQGADLSPFLSQLDACALQNRRLDKVKLNGVGAVGLTDDVDALLAAWREALTALQGGNLASALTQTVTVADPLAARLLTETMPEFQSSVARHVVETRATFQERSQRADALIAAASLFVLFSTLLLSLALRRLELGVRGLMGGSTAYTQGNLGHRIEPSSVAEIDAVAEQMNLMAAELNRARAELLLRASELESSLASLQAAQESLVVQEKMAALGGLVAGVAHEINTPIGVAITAVTFARDELEQLKRTVEEAVLDREEVAEAIEALNDAFQLIHVNTRRAGDLVASFKQVAVDRADVNLRDVELKGWVESVLTSLTPMARRDRVALSSRILVESERLRLAPGLLEQVLTNLIVNSIRHGFPDDWRSADGAASPNVDVVLTTSSTKLTLSVSDNGCGMAEAVQKKVFDPFYTTQRGRGGTGLGMHIVHQIIVGRFGGRIELDSKVGSGTRWSLTVPIVNGTVNWVGEAPNRTR